MSWGLEGAVVDVDGVPGLIDVDLEVGPGEAVAVVGGDGAGKTTLARTLVGLLSPRKGAVRRPEPRRIGYQAATSGVWPDLTVGENLGFVADAHRLTGEGRRRRISELLSVTGLEAAHDRLGAALSGGMRQKLGVAMALLPEPSLLVLDEPTTGVDPVSRLDLWRLVSAVTGRGTAVVFTTTYLEEAERAGSIVALDSGRVLASGSVDEIAGSVEGVIIDAFAPGGRAWRRGRTWRAWVADGSVPHGASRVDPDLTDLLVAASLAAEAGR